MPIPNLIKDYTAWEKEAGLGDNAAIERVMDNAAYTSAHPDDTFVFAGPPRLPNGATGSTDGTYGAFSAVGMLQNITINQSKPFQPMMAIGSARSFYLGGKAQGSAQVGRLFMNTQNLMRRLYDNIYSDELAGSVSAGNPPAATNKASETFLINLDSELFLIPFGLGVVFKNKARQAIGGFYLELCCIPNYTVSVTAGQSMIMEGVSLLYDRLFPLTVAEAQTMTSVLDKIIDPAGIAGG